MHRRSERVAVVLEAMRRGEGRVGRTCVCIAPPYIIVEVELTVTVNEQNMAPRANGLATCSPDDDWNEALGKLIAQGRAETRLAMYVAKNRAIWAAYLQEIYDGWVRRDEAQTAARNAAAKIEEVALCQQ